ncbi:MAG: hypothetical protein WEG56_09805 [Chloroflexota bacterium]
MGDVKQGYREAENKAKETWRKADGEEDLADKAGNLGDDIRQGLGNAGDKARDMGDDAKREADRDRTNSDRL